MYENSGNNAEVLQQLIARTVATHPAGRNLMLIGGFRYRFLDGSVRTSTDIDYHWDGDLDQKQQELIDLFNRVLLPDVRRRLGYSGSAMPNTGPDADSPSVRTVNLAFWKEGVAYSRIEIPVEVTRIMCLDPVTIRTAGGIVYATASDTDMVESKVIAVLNRTVLRHRDMVDIFLFKSSLVPESKHRLRKKIQALNLPERAGQKRILDLQTHCDYHARASQEIIDTQLDPTAAEQISDAGGGEMILNTVLDIFQRYDLYSRGAA